MRRGSLGVFVVLPGVSLVPFGVCFEASIERREILDSDKGDILCWSCQEGKQNIFSFVKTTNYKTFLILGTPLP